MTDKIIRPNTSRLFSIDVTKGVVAFKILKLECMGLRGYFSDNQNMGTLVSPTIECFQVVCCCCSISIDGKRLNTCAKRTTHWSWHQPYQKWQKLWADSEKYGVEINKSNTKIMIVNRQDNHFLQILYCWTDWTEVASYEVVHILVL